MTIEIEILILIAALIAAVSIGIGYWWASASQKRAAGGKTVNELTEEKKAYEEQVVEHFKTTADLLNEMTDKYRDVYRHMAEGAQNLAPVDSAAPALAALQNGLLTAPTESRDSETVIESQGTEVATSESAETGAEQAATEGEEAAELPNDEQNEQPAPSNDPVDASSSNDDSPADELEAESPQTPTTGSEFFSSGAKTAHKVETQAGEDQASAESAPDSRN